MHIAYYIAFLHITLLHEWHITQTTIKWNISSMYALMCRQITLLCEQLIIHITRKWMLSTLCVLVCLQMTLPSERLITHITGKRMLSTVCVDVTSDYPAVWTTYYTHWSYLFASHQKNYSAPQMPYSIHDLNMDDPHHVCVRVLAKYSVKRPERTILDRIWNGNRNTTLSQHIYIYTHTHTHTHIMYINTRESH